MDLRPLPEPGSDELTALLGSGVHAQLYGFLYRRRSNPPSMLETRYYMVEATGDDQTQVDRRVRELRRNFDVRSEYRDGEHRHVLLGWATQEAADGADLSLRRRAQVLAPGRCAMCGRTPLVDQIKLVVDHKLPLAWGGTNDLENLQPLCEDCNAGKKDYYSSYDDHADKIRLAASHDEPQKRIGELLRAFDGAWVRNDLLAAVASAKEYQEDWQRRLRDLRWLGWDYEFYRKNETGRRVTYYRVTKSAPWPTSIRGAIRDEEERRARAKRS